MHNKIWALAHCRYFALNIATEVLCITDSGMVGWSGGAKVLGNLPVPGRVLLIWIIVEQGPIALAVGAGGGCLDIFSLVYLFSILSPSLGDGPL